jgi:hypothetical protein
LGREMARPQLRNLRSADLVFEQQGRAQIGVGAGSLRLRGEPEPSSIWRSLPR